MTNYEEDNFVHSKTLSRSNEKHIPHKEFLNAFYEPNRARGEKMYSEKMF